VTALPAVIGGSIIGGSIAATTNGPMVSANVYSIFGNDVRGEFLIEACKPESGEYRVKYISRVGMPGSAKVQVRSKQNALRNINKFEIAKLQGKITDKENTVAKLEADIKECDEEIRALRSRLNSI
jgi:hypothetical protein